MKREIGSFTQAGRHSRRDMAGYSRLIGADGSGTLQAPKTVRAEPFEPTIAEHYGHPVRATGDGFLVEFSSVVDALCCATEMRADRVEAQCSRGKRARLTAMPTGSPSGLRRPMALFLNIMLACALLCGAGSIPDATAQMHTQSLELGEGTIPQLQSALTAGIVTSHDLVTLYLARIDAYDQHGPALNAISVTNGKALAEADARDAERRAGARRGPLHGIPIIVKDNYDTTDLQTAAGSRSLAGWVPPDDAFLVTKLREAGAIIIAKSNMHEFAYGITTLGSLFGQTRNPYSLDRNPGGSSGGTGAAIAANFAAAGMGSDTCGSIRIPAAHNSLVGIRGTQGLASRNGIIPLSSTQDIGGPIGRTVTDAAIVLDAIVGYDPTDPQTAASVGNIPKSYTDFLQLSGLRGARIGLLAALLGTDPADAEVASVLRGAVDEMKGQGVEIVDVAIPGLGDLLTDRANGFLVLRQDFKFDLNAYLAARPSAPVRTLEEVLASGKFHPAVETNLRNSQAVEARDTQEYFAHIVKRNILREAILKAMAENRIEALAYPTIRRKASVIGEMQMGSNCHLSANSGLPAIVVPGGFTPDGLPVGVELLGRAWSEPQLIKFAYAYEQATQHRRPPTSTPALDHR
jgi:Asp-tRNA(Asn)/Glu-tRNA(Gln) amidotransferase A subunit family amidase